VFEYWAHEACLLPSADEPHYRRDKRASGEFHRWYGPILQEHKALADEVMALARERGEISSRDFGGAGKGYWEWTPAKRVLDALWTAPARDCRAQRDERRYALPERVLPQEVLRREPSADATRRMQVERAVRARGIASEARVSDYFRVRGGRRTLAPAIEELVAAGVLERVRMRERGDLWLVPAEDAERAIAGDDRPTGAFLLSPFDNLVWDRFEAEHLFGFEHRLEIYKPAPARIYGYYVLPLLDGPDVVGRIDMKADRKAGTLRALAVHWQRRQRPRALREALGRLAHALGLERSEIRVEFETRAIHAGQEPDPLTGSVNVPIYQTSTYAQDGVLQMRGGHDYARTINPTRTALEQCLASLEGGAHGVCFSSGMGATTAIMELFAPGSRTVAINDVYGGTYRLFSKLYESKGYAYEFADLTDEATARQAFERPADLVWLETPSNPLLKIVDIAAIAERAHAAGAVVVVDNTFASPYLQQPLALGADIVVHSTTKYIGGHSDAVGGAAITNDAETAERLHFVQNSMGAVPGPLDCFLTLRGAKTLAVRMERHSDNAAAIARWLTESPAVSHVYYPGLATHPGHETATRQMRRFGGMIASRCGGRAAVDAALADRCVDRVRAGRVEA
jgi:cystathionine gamma-synthase